jgi:hypothetical protein
MFSFFHIQPIAVDDPDENGWWLMSDAEYVSGTGVK